MQYLNRVIDSVKNISVPNINMPNIGMPNIGMPNTTVIYEYMTDNVIINTITNTNYGSLIPDYHNYIPNYHNYILTISNLTPNFTKVYDNGLIDMIKNVDVSDAIHTYNPINIPIMILSMIMNFFVLHLCRISVALMVSLWIAIFVMRYMLIKSISLYNLTFAIFVNLLFLMYFPSQCLVYT